MTIQNLESRVSSSEPGFVGVIRWSLRDGLVIRVLLYFGPVRIQRVSRRRPDNSAVSRPQQRDSYLPEITAEYAAGLLIMFLRVGVRLRTVGIKGFQGDDWLIFLAIVFYTIDFAMCHIAYSTGSNIDVRPEQVDSLSDEDVSVLELGSKIEFVTWYSYPAFIWTLKFCILFFYKRLTVGIAPPQLLAGLFWFCGATWASLVVSVSLTCRPYSANWQVRPLPGFHCIFRAQNFIALAILNILTDVAILTVPLPLLRDLHVHWSKKLLVTLLLCSGLFLISAAIVRVALTLGSAPSVLTVNSWGFRETVVAILAVSAPVLSPVLRPSFWTWGSYRGAALPKADAAAAVVRRKPFGNWLGTWELQSVGGSMESKMGRHLTVLSLKTSRSRKLKMKA
ncbi:hypothetical protein P8C59_002729 [Phyllachora maydis]|uniref:Rhodopsin domain-containing protein n=1 Tax=Phyllachora maydis TaxID=1825666 RepID=A0AAD9MBQ7_9PEZI|nr:hypothetical protein P8C59_002729 [Phyllachora maydis]